MAWSTGAGVSGGTNVGAIMEADCQTLMTALIDFPLIGKGNIGTRSLGLQEQLW